MHGLIIIILCIVEFLKIAKEKSSKIFWIINFNKEKKYIYVDMLWKKNKKLKILRFYRLYVF